VAHTRQRSGGSQFEANPRNKSETLPQKYPKQKRAGRMVEHLTSKHEALRSNPKYNNNNKSKAQRVGSMAQVVQHMSFQVQGPKFKPKN
jgi:hypothetical protein